MKPGTMGVDWGSARMPYNRLSTAKIARLIGVHPNTVRIYEAWGFIPLAPRAPNGYRQYEPAHVDHMRLARLVMREPFAGVALRRLGIAMVLQAAAGDLAGALEQAAEYQRMVHSEQAHADEAATVLERWAAGAPQEPVGPLRIGQAARLLDVTIDMLRNWERSGLIDVPRDPANGYRQYGTPEVARLRVIRMLLKAGYSTMAVLRMLVDLEAGRTDDLRRSLDTPRPDEDAAIASDRWLTSLAEHAQRSREIITLLEEMLVRQ
ncbi:MAG TPA: MerR family transcriptional regulator [Anaerolineaceae bacterium]|nr:MerR family transcriptional regulator [Anaerolineaceae bacterium]